MFVNTEDEALDDLCKDVIKFVEIFSRLDDEQRAKTLALLRDLNKEEDAPNSLESTTAHEI